jgi:hypothetical protein
MNHKKTASGCITHKNTLIPQIDGVQHSEFHTEVQSKTNKVHLLDPILLKNIVKFRLVSALVVEESRIRIDINVDSLVDDDVSAFVPMESKQDGDGERMESEPVFCGGDLRGEFNKFVMEFTSTCVLHTMVRPHHLI